MIYYSDDESVFGSSHNISDFLAANSDVDGFLIEAGCYVHVLNNLLGTNRFPLMGVMTEKPQYGNVCPKAFEAAFKDDIYDKAIEMLLELIHSGKKIVDNIKIEPYLVKDEFSRPNNLNIESVIGNR